MEAAIDRSLRKCEAECEAFDQRMAKKWENFARMVNPFEALPPQQQSQQHTPTGYAPYIRKRRTSEESHPPQVPNKIQITPKILPVWTPPQPTLSPQEQSQPIHLLPTTIPPLPTPPAALPTNHPENNPIKQSNPS